MELQQVSDRLAGITRKSAPLHVSMIVIGNVWSTKKKRKRPYGARKKTNRIVGSAP